MKTVTLTAGQVAALAKYLRNIETNDGLNIDYVADHQVVDLVEAMNALDGGHRVAEDYID